MFAAALVSIVAAFPAKARAAPEVPRFLVIYQEDAVIAANLEIAAGIASALNSTPTGQEVFSEHLDMTRFPGRAHAEAIATLLADKYRDLPMAAVMAVGPGALDFVLEHRNDIAPGAPVVFGGLSARSDQLGDLPADVRGVVSMFDVRGTADLARRLQPEAGRLVVVTGSAPFDRGWQERARGELAPLEGEIELDFVSDLSLAGFEEMAAGLGPDAILLILSVVRDGEERVFVPRDAAAAIAAASSAPAYGVYSSFIGVGLLGGRVETFASIGKAMAEMALEAAAGETGGPPFVSTVPKPVVDWRQIRRFGIDASLLPPGTVRLFYEPTAWERYRVQILLAAALMLLQSGTIAALVIQERRRRRIADELAVGRLEVAHLSRTAQLGALSGALAHELNQPLASILANAEAGAREIGRAAPDMKELSEILADIADDDRRAAGIITQLRRLMVKGDTALEDVELNQMVQATVTLARGELIARRTRVEVRREGPELTVHGNFAQLQQVVLNLLLNAADAMADLPPAERRILVDTRLLGDRWRELAVSDRGPGLAPDMLEEAFKPFVSSKPSGLGFGLPICRSIIRAHGGTLLFDPDTVDGARIVMTLPPAAP